MSRFALFTVAFFVLIAIGSQSGQGGSLNRSIKSMCVCVPTRAGLMMKSAIAKAHAQVRSAEILTQRVAAAQ
jgi:hypothetical protein